MSEILENRYKQILDHIFFDADFGGYEQGDIEVEFTREQIVGAAKALGVELPKNLGDVVYSIRYRTPLPKRIIATQPKGLEWVIEGAGRAKYAFRLVSANRISPNKNLRTIKLPDATPEIIGAYALNDEQALLAKVRYNRIIDIFLGLTAFSLQSHMRTTVAKIGQIEIDEIYVGIDRQGIQYVIPVQAKGGKDQLGIVQAKQDLACCAEKFPGLVCRSISTQFLEDDRIAVFEVGIQEDRVVVLEERHYVLVPASQITDSDLAAYRQTSHPL